VQEGVSALLRGATLAIKPEGFEVAHRRGAEVAVQVPVKSSGNGNGHRRAVGSQLSGDFGRPKSSRFRQTEIESPVPEIELVEVAVQVPVKSNGNGNGHRR
jgi:hypothetical protein